MEVVKNVSGFVDDFVANTPYDWRSPCGANNCECYENSKKIEAVIDYLSKLK